MELSSLSLLFVILFSGPFWGFCGAVRAILPLANGCIAHLFVVCGYQGAEVDAHELVVIAGDLNAVFFSHPCHGQSCLPLLVGGLGEGAFALGCKEYIS